ncbi:hypothetical protein KFZ56_15555 [Virgibacillus sp. NKC19-3]|uniref:hypothetical protein n=1 Tax=Virgibacillus saliphilus TaxID=2831674 RepID=UPI001C9A7B92|nr:hypothetical protein [Virgibacillus sp. NKC19-3]MBY7144439.1 hypothetical protein [Virgibacillus sp. NKC19-3]
MISYDAYQSEKRQVDNLVKEGYIITGSKGTLDGDVVDFEHKKTSDKKSIRLTSPDSRKYFATMYIKQQQRSTT